MKKTLYTLTAVICFTSAVSAQSSVPNGSFENWNNQTYQMPQYATQSSNAEAFFKANAPFNCVRTSDAYHGSYAIKLTTEVTVSDAVTAFFINGNPDSGNPSTWTGGIPYTEQATGIQGYYKSDIAAGDTGLIILDFKKGGSSIGFYTFKLYGVHGAYTQFSFPLSPALSATPDSIIFGATSSDILDNIVVNNSMLQLDSISLTGVNNQPAQLNGDFESWQSVDVYSLPGWYVEGDKQGGGIYQTADAVTGNYAAEMITYASNQNNTTKASGAQISTGWQLCSDSGGECIQEGGYPYSNQSDTFAFYYKYTPSGSDSAYVNLNFKRDGAQIWGMGMNLGASAEYKYVEIPFNIGSVPDTAIVLFQSSLWRDTAMSFVGSDLKIDDAIFKSQAVTGVKEVARAGQISVYPNPSRDGSFYVTNSNMNDLIRVYNIFGETQKVSVAQVNSISKISLPETADGIYFVRIESKGEVITQKVIVKR